MRFRAGPEPLPGQTGIPVDALEQVVVSVVRGLDALTIPGPGSPEKYSLRKALIRFQRKSALAVREQQR